MARISNSTLIEFLRSKDRSAGRIDRLKTVYRPLICPFDDLLQYVGPDNRVFDIGCGRGQFALLLAQFAAPQAIGGIEISDELTAAATAALQDYAGRMEVDIRRYDGAELPASIARYDTIFMIDVLHHLRPGMRDAFLHDLYRRMAPGARLILKDINRAHPLVVANKLHDLLLAGEIGHELSVAEAQQVAEAAGFVTSHISKRRMWWYPHYTLVLSTPKPA